MIDQLELDMAEAGSKEDISPFLALLWRQRDWLTAAEIDLQTGWSDRKCRALAAASEGRIISGNRGYKHTAHATPEEFQEFYGRMTEQGKAMLARAEQARRVHHACVG
jgi:hypothetical protein